MAGIRNNAAPKIVALDAIGVIYPAGEGGNDVKNLLVPFIREKGGTRDIDLIEELYLQASLGRMTAAQLWRGIGLDPMLEDEYLKRFDIAPGLIDFLRAMNSRQIAVWCLSNDLSQWSRKLRLNFGLDKYIQGFVISGDIMIRKPDPAVFKHLLSLTGAKAREILFVDDQLRNLESADALGFNTALFCTDCRDMEMAGHRVVRTFNELLNLLA